MSSPHARSDAELAAQLAAGDTAALGQLYDRYVHGIHDYLARFTRDPAAAEDLTHSTFLRAWERRSTLRDPSRVRAWLYATAHNLAVNHVTRARHADSIDDEAAGRVADPARGPEEEALARDAAELVWAAASSLEPRQYAVLDLSVRQGLSTREIADVLGVPAGHAAVLVNRGREALGSAVRYLLVARRRDHCERLAALVPAGVRALSARERSAVDHHMRRCESCQELGRRLTEPSQLLGALLPMPLPASLGVEGRRRLVAAVHAAPGGAGGPGAGGPPRPPRRGFWDGRGRLAAGLVVLLVLLTVAAGAAAGYRFRQEPAQLAERLTVPESSPSLPATALATPAPSDTPSAIPSPTPSASPSPSARPSPTPTATPTPAFAVTAVTVVSRDRGACPKPPGSNVFVCTFTVTITVVNAAGSEVVQGTLTATTPKLPPNTPPKAAQFRMTAGKPTADVSVQYATCPMGTAVAATAAPPAPVTSKPAPFGAC